MAYKIITRIIGGLLLAAVLALGTLSVLFAMGNGSAGLFGHGIYLVGGTGFEMLKPGDAAFGEFSPAADSAAGDIIVYRERQSGTVKFGKVINVSTENGLVISVSDETGSQTDITQDGFIAKITQRSAILGNIIGFVRSPSV